MPERKPTNQAKQNDSDTVEMAKRMRAGVQSATPSEIFQRSVDEVNYSTCLPCHGAQSEGSEAIYAPPLAGQERWYLKRQIKNFRQSIRGGNPNDVHGAVMHPIARALMISGDLEAVLDEIDEFPVHDPAPTMEGGQIEEGHLIYRQLCQRCHGDYGEGNEQEGGPRLNMLPDWYIIRQLRNFQAGFRGEHEKDDYGHEMRPMSLTVMKRQEMLNVAAYIHTLGFGMGSREMSEDAEGRNHTKGEAP